MKIRQKTLIVIFVVVLVTGAVTTIVGRTIAMNIVEDEISDHLVTTAQSRAQTVRLALESQQQGIEILAREAEAYMATMQPGGLGFLVKDRLVVSVLLNGIASSMEQVRDALCLDQNGIVVAATSERFLGFDASDWEVFSELSKGNRNTFVGDIQDSPLGEFVNGEAASEFLLATAAPFRTAGDLEGVVVFLGGEKELSEITTDVTGLGKTGEVYLVNSDGFMLTESRFREDAIMQVKTDTAGGSGDSEGAGQELISTTSYMGSKVLRICEPLPETGWTVVVEMGSSEAFAPVSTLTRVMLWSLLGVLLLGVVAAIGISKALTRPIVRLHRGAEEVMRGNWDCSLSTSAKDEIGELSRAFGKMTANLKRSHEELRHYSESLETKVEERTRALATANEELNREIIERKQAEKALQEAHDELEMRVLERTEQLAETNAILEEEIMERKRAEEEALQRNRELAALNALAQTINQSVDLDEILRNALDKTLEILNVQDGSIHLMDKEGDTLSARIVRGVPSGEAKGVSTIRVGEGIGGVVAQKGEPTFVESLSDVLRSLHEDAAQIILQHDLKSAMFVPLKARGVVLGMMSAVTRGDRVFTTEERELVITIGHQIGTAIQNTQLVEEASRAEALEELDRLRSALLASVSHELRTPLTSIKGLASTLTQPDIEWDRETQREFLMIIDRESNILARIVSDLMEMSQIEAGVMRMEKAPITISAIVSQLRDQLKHLVVKHQFEADIPPGLPQIYVDEMRIGEVITNLVANAAAYSEPGTRITLQAREVDGDIVVSVIDEGIGIPAEHRGKIFDRFYRLESGVARRRGGTGLGLSISKRIVEEHGGRIWVESKVGRGSKFSFSIPVVKLAKASQKVASVPEA